MPLKDIVNKLKNLSDYEIIFTKHAKIRLIQRQIKEDLVVEHLRKPNTLQLVEKRAAKPGDEKYKLWFIPSKRIAYIY
ncbi:MAG: hypothetical protein J7L44_04470, partial [Candidatus Diapherotrites archaeon]|nr:hypothetical protein [Candidatus Diapherotrites archaeon]